MAMVTVMIGVPGSGKTTWIKENMTENTMVISRDSLREMIQPPKYVYREDIENNFIKQASRQLILLAYHNGYDVIVDETNIRKSDRAAIFSCIQGAMVKFVYFPYNEECLNRRMREPRGYDRDKWEQVINEMLDVFEEPTEDECHELITIGGKR